MHRTPMHPFVAPVLLRMPGSDPLQLDSQLQPTDQQARRSTHRGRGKRAPVVGSNRYGKPVLPEETLEHLPGLRLLRRVQPYNPQHKPAVGIYHRQRVGQPMIAGQELALEISSPDRIGLGGLAQRRQGRPPRLNSTKKRALCIIRVVSSQASESPPELSILSPTTCYPCTRSVPSRPPTGRCPKPHFGAFTRSLGLVGLYYHNARLESHQRLARR